MNPLDENLTKGTFGELLVQIRLLQYGVQAAPPIKDSGNDLIAISGEVFCAIQVKTRTSYPIKVDRLPNLYHFLAIVVLDPQAEGRNISLDACSIFFIPKNEVKSTFHDNELKRYILCEDLITHYFGSD